MPNRHLRTEDFAALLDGAPDAIVVVDDRGTIEFANRRTTDLFAWAPQDLVGRTIETLVPDRLHEIHLANRARYTAAPSVRPMGSDRTLFARRRDGSEFPVEISLSPLQTDRGILISSIIRDVTDRVQREDELRRMRELADKANAAKSEFLSSMSHELRTPLNAVLGFAQLLARSRNNPLDERQQDMLGHIMKGGAHLLRLIDEVLDLARIEAGSITISTESVFVDALLEEVTSSLEPLARRAGITIEHDPLPLGVAAVTGDRTRLAQILVNFGSNAVKYGRPNGTIRFTAEVADGSAVRFSVTDDGIGIPADKHDQVFQPFQRAGQELGTIEGTGIGLAISKRLAELMQGRIGFVSEHGRGSTFWVELPADTNAGRSAALTDGPAERSGLLAEREAPPLVVVYVEDNPANVELMAHILAQYDRVELLAAPNAEKGIDLIESRLPALVIMDVNLPGMSGIEATKLLRESPRTRDIPVIGLSAAAMPRDRRLAEDAGFFRYLTKPFDVDEMLDALESALTRVR